MEKCIFCHLDKNKIENTIIEETQNFYITPALGSLVEGYLLIISKRHTNSMAELNQNEKKEYVTIIKNYRTMFKKIYGRYPIIFEHGTSTFQKNLSASSVRHAHTHIVNHHYKNEKQIIKELNLEVINSNFNIERKDKSYIFYISPENIHYISYHFKPTSQIMRILISKDLKIEDKYNWRDYTFEENIKKTIQDFKYEINEI